jgi:hypothetical protein
MRQTTRFWGTAQARDGRPSRGQSVVELALMLPIMVIVIAGIVDLGRIYYAYITVVNVAREGARFAAAHPPKPSCAQGLDPSALTAIEERARHEAQAAGITQAQLSILVQCDSGDHEQPIRVTVWYNFRPILTQMLLVGQPIRLHSETVMQIFAQ